MKESRDLPPSVFDVSDFLLNRSALQRKELCLIYSSSLSHVSCCIVNAAWVREDEEEEEKEGERKE